MRNYLFPYNNYQEIIKCSAYSSTFCTYKIVNINIESQVHFHSHNMIYEKKFDEMNSKNYKHCINKIVIAGQLNVAKL